MFTRRIVFSAILSAFAAAAFSTPLSAKTPFGELRSKQNGQPALPEAGKPPAGDPILGGPGTYTPVYIENLEHASAALTRLDQDTRTLYPDQASLISRIKNIGSFLQTSANRLAMLSTLDSDLKKLEKAVLAVDSAAEAAEAIPQAREKAKKIRASLSATKADVTAARQRMDNIVEKTEPIREKLQTASDQARKLDLVLTAVNEGPVANMRFPVSIAAGCLKKLPEEKQACAAKNLDATAADVDAAVLEYDRVVRLLLANPEPWLPSVKFFDPFNADLAGVDALREEIENLYSRLERLEDELSGLNSVLRRSFSFKFPYPDPTWTNPVRFSHYKVKIGFRTIIKGANAIEGEIEHILSKFLWRVLKDVGVGKFVKDLEHEANSAVNSLMREVNFDVNVDLPSMNALAPFEREELILAADLEALKFPSLDTSLPAFGFPNVNPGVDFGKIKACFSFFNPGGLSVNAPNLCEGAAYGCAN